MQLAHCMPIYLYGSLQFFADVRRANADFSSAREKQTREICAAFGVPPEYLVHHPVALLAKGFHEAHAAMEAELVESFKAFADSSSAFPDAEARTTSGEANPTPAASSPGVDAVREGEGR